MKSCSQLYPPRGCLGAHLGGWDTSRQLNLLQAIPDELFCKVEIPGGPVGISRWSPGVGLLIPGGSGIVLEGWQLDPSG